jgi:hypothetical protein
VLQLQDVYVSMANSFSAHGLDLEAIGETAAWFETGGCAALPQLVVGAVVLGVGGAQLVLAAIQ